LFKKNKLLSPYSKELKNLCMQKIFLVNSLLFLLFTTSCSKALRNGENKNSVASSASIPSDRLATKETVALFNYLKNVGRTGMLFGQHHASVESQNWKNTNMSIPFESDVKTATGDHPAVFGFDFGNNISRFKNHVEEIYKMGGIITYSWHCPNPVNGEGYRDQSGDPVTSILPGGKKHKEWLKQLDEVAKFFNGITVEGVKVPIIFRPFHENTGAWFWWGSKSCTDAEYIQLWRMTVDYLRNEKDVHNLLLAYSPSKPTETMEMTKARYPGDDYVDIIGLDIYGPNEPLKKLLIEGTKFVTTWSKEKGKIPAITELGIKKGIQNSTTNDWFMSEFLNLIKDDSSAEAAFVLTWKNSNPQSYWVPLKGQPSYQSFINFYNDPYTLFLKDTKSVYGDKK
jgi:mannan endo-1,4-beta-mannosidase